MKRQPRLSVMIMRTRQPHDLGSRACPAPKTPERASHHQADITPLCRSPEHGAATRRRTLGDGAGREPPCELSGRSGHQHWRARAACPATPNGATPSKPAGPGGDSSTSNLLDSAGRLPGGTAASNCQRSQRGPSPTGSGPSVNRTTVRARHKWPRGLPDCRPCRDGYLHTAPGTNPAEVSGSP